MIKPPSRYKVITLTVSAPTLLQEMGLTTVKALMKEHGLSQTAAYNISNEIKGTEGFYMVEDKVRGLTYYAFSAAKAAAIISCKQRRGNPNFKDPGEQRKLAIRRWEAARERQQRAAIHVASLKDFAARFDGRDTGGEDTPA